MTETPMNGSLITQTLEDSGNTKLVDWNNPPSLTDLKSDFEASKPYHDSQMVEIDKWNDLRLVRGKFKPKKIKGRSSIQPKVIRRQAEWRYSALSEPFLNSPKIFKVTAVTAPDVNSASQNEILINYQFRTKLNKVRFIDNFVRSAVDDGTVCVKLGWSRVTTPTEQEVPVFSHYAMTDPNDLQQFQGMIQQYSNDPNGFAQNASPEILAAIKYYQENNVPTIAKQTGTQIEKTEFILENKPTVDVVDPRNVYLDPSCNGDVDKALFCIFAFETNKADLLKEKRYKNLDNVNWDGNTSVTATDYQTNTPNDFSFKDPARKKVVAYEYWGYYDIDGDGTLKPFVATWIGSTLIRMELNPFPDQKIPLVIATYNPIKRELYGESDAEVLEDNQKIIGATTRGIVDLLGRSANAQMGMAKGTLDPLNQKRFDEGSDYQFNPNLPPNVAMYSHKYPEIPQSAIQVINLQNNDAESLSGVKAFTGGISGDAYGNVATGIRGALDAASKREMSILRRLAEGMSEVGKKIISMNGEFLTEEEVVPITDEEFVTVTRDQLQGDYNVIVDISTAEIDNAQAQDLGFMLQTIGPAVQDVKITTTILAKICDLKRLPDLALMLRNYQPPPPDPMAQQIQLAELELMKAKTNLATAQAQLAVAQAGKAGSEKDLKDLQFVETETGTSHARNMQLAGAQAKGNQDLQVTKALTTPTKEGEKEPNVSAAIGFNQLSDANSTTGQPE